MLNQINLSRIDLNLLVVFSAVLRERQVASAADKLNLTPSAISHALMRLRRLLNDPLFLRTPIGVVPTARALQLGEPVSDILARIGGVVASAIPFDPLVSTRRFRIGAPEAVLAWLTTPLLHRINRRAPNVDVGLLHLMPSTRSPGKDPWQESLQQLEQRDIDIAVLPRHSVPPRFAARRLFDEDFVVAMRKGHRLERSPTIKEFCRFRHMLVSADADPHGFVDDILSKRGLTRRVALTVPTFTLALTQLGNVDMVAVLPRRLVTNGAARFGLTYAELPFKRKPDPVVAVAPKSAMMDKGIAFVVDLLAEAAGSRPI
jgi:DNA-binding transcriptional LysR family regulator